MSEHATETRIELKHLVLVLSELLDRAIATQGELSAREWQQMERAQVKAHGIKHPETFDGEEAEAIVRRRDASAALLEAAKGVLAVYERGDYVKSIMRLSEAVDKAEGGY